MSEDTPTTEAPVSGIVTETPAGFTEQTGLSQGQATRVTAAVLGVIGASLPDGLTPRQTLTAAINIIGMVAAEIVAGTGGNETQRADLIGSITAFVTKNSTQLAKAYEQAAQFQQFLEATVAADGKPQLEEGQKPN